jgi:hypothetical protein
MTAYWQMKKREVFLSRGNCCCKCRKAEGTATLELHHVMNRPTRRIGGLNRIIEALKYPQRMIILCSECHLEEHRRK